MKAIYNFPCKYEFLELMKTYEVIRENINKSITIKTAHGNKIVSKKYFDIKD